MTLSSLLLPPLLRSSIPIIGLSCLFAYSVAAADQTSSRQVIGDFSQGSLSDWQQKTFQGSTDYQLLMVDGRQVLKATSKQSASALYRTVQIDLTKTPLLNWSWRVDAVDASLNPLAKVGDDYPARIYVVKKGFFPWQTKALNYVWANSHSDKAYWPNPFTASAVMIPVKAGSDGLGRWHTERVDVKADFLRVFNLSVDTADGVSIMSDSDNGKGSTSAYFSELYFSAD